MKLISLLHFTNFNLTFKAVLCAYHLARDSQCGWIGQEISFIEEFPMSAYLIGHCCRSVFPSFVVITAWVTLLYVVGLAGRCRAVTSIGRRRW